MHFTFLGKRYWFSGTVSSSFDPNAAGVTTKIEYKCTESDERVQTDQEAKEEACACPADNNDDVTDDDDDDDVSRIWYIYTLLSCKCSAPFGLLNRMCDLSGR